MGLFSKRKDPLTIANELVATSMSLELSEEEMAWIPRLYVDDSWYVRERNVLRMGMTQGGVALANGHMRRSGSPRTHLAEALHSGYRQYFMQMSGIDPAEADHYYLCTSERYVVRKPDEMVLIFHHYLQNPGHWRDRDQETSLPSSIPEGFQSLVHATMKCSLELAVARAKELEG